MKSELHFVYQTTNLIDGKIYIGVHSTSNINDGYLGSGKLLTRAIKKYGRENFVKEVLSFYDSREEAFEEERFIVTKEWVKSSNNYNLIIGGVGTNRRNIKAKSNGRFLENVDRYPSGRRRYPVKGRNNIESNSNKVIDLVTGKVYPSLAELARVLNESPSGLRYRISKKRKGYNYEIITNSKYSKLKNT